MLKERNLADYPYTACASATAFTAETGRVVRTFKDAGEQRLSDPMALCMACTLPMEWRFDAVTFVPASQDAMRRRGFDHGLLLGRAFAARVGKPLAHTLGRPRTRDQRALSRRARLANADESFEAVPASCAGLRFVLVDDVHTTGATVCEAARILRAAGARDVYCLTFARV